MNLIAIAVIGATVATTPITLDDSAPMPPLKRETVNGMWQGISTETPAVVLLSIDTRGDSFIAIAQGHADSMDVETYKVSSIDVQKGQVDIKVADYTGKAPALRVLGKGRAYANGEGTIQATVSRFFTSPAGTDVVKWKIELVRRPSDFIDDIAALKKGAARGLACERSGTDCSKPPRTKAPPK